MNFVNGYSINGGFYLKKVVLGLLFFIFSTLFAADGREIVVYSPLVKYGDPSRVQRMIMTDEQRIEFQSCYGILSSRMRFNHADYIQKLTDSFEKKYKDQSLEDLQARMQKYKDDFCAVYAVSDFEARSRARVYVRDGYSLTCDKKSKIFNLEYAHLNFFLRKMKYKEFFKSGLEHDTCDAMASLCVLKKIALLDGRYLRTIDNHDLCNINGEISRLLLCSAMIILVERCLLENVDIKNIILNKCGRSC